MKRKNSMKKFENKHSSAVRRFTQPIKKVRDRSTIAPRLKRSLLATSKLKHLTYKQYSTINNIDNDRTLAFKSLSPVDQGIMRLIKAEKSYDMDGVGHMHTLSYGSALRATVGGGTPSSSSHLKSSQDDIRGLSSLPIKPSGLSSSHDSILLARVVNPDETKGYLQSRRESHNVLKNMKRIKREQRTTNNDRSASSSSSKRGRNSMTSPTTKSSNRDALYMNVSGNQNKNNTASASSSLLPPVLDSPEAMMRTIQQPIKKIHRSSSSLSSDNRLYRRQLSPSSRLSAIVNNSLSSPLNQLMSALPLVSSSSHHSPILGRSAGISTSTKQSKSKISSARSIHTVVSAFEAAAQDDKKKQVKRQQRHHDAMPSTSSSLLGSDEHNNYQSVSSTGYTPVSNGNTALYNTTTVSSSSIVSGSIPSLHSRTKRLRNTLPHMVGRMSTSALNDNNNNTNTKAIPMPAKSSSQNTSYNTQTSSSSPSASSPSSHSTNTTTKRHQHNDTTSTSVRLGSSNYERGASQIEDDIWEMGNDLPYCPPPSSSSTASSSKSVSSKSTPQQQHNSTSNHRRSMSTFARTRVLHAGFDSNNMGNNNNNGSLFDTLKGAAIQVASNAVKDQFNKMTQNASQPSRNATNNNASGSGIDTTAILRGITEGISRTLTQPSNNSSSTNSNTASNNKYDDHSHHQENARNIFDSTAQALQAAEKIFGYMSDSSNSQRYSDHRSTSEGSYHRTGSPSLSSTSTTQPGNDLLSTAASALGKIINGGATSSMGPVGASLAALATGLMNSNSSSSNSGGSSPNIANATQQAKSSLSNQLSAISNVIKTAAPNQKLACEAVDAINAARSTIDVATKILHGSSSNAKEIQDAISNAAKAMSVIGGALGLTNDSSKVNGNSDQSKMSSSSSSYDRSVYRGNDDSPRVTEATIVDNDDRDTTEMSRNNQSRQRDEMNDNDSEWRSPNRSRDQYNRSSSKSSSSSRKDINNTIGKQGSPGGNWASPLLNAAMGAANDMMKPLNLAPTSASASESGGTTAWDREIRQTGAQPSSKYSGGTTSAPVLDNNTTTTTNTSRNRTSSSRQQQHDPRYIEDQVQDCVREGAHKVLHQLGEQYSADNLKSLKEEKMRPDPRDMTTIVDNPAQRPSPVDDGSPNRRPRQM